MIFLKILNSNLFCFSTSTYNYNNLKLNKKWNKISPSILTEKANVINFRYALVCFFRKKIFTDFLQ